MPNINIKKNQTNFIKGVGILLIVLHNYYHLVSPNTGENEFVFDAQYTKNLFDMILDNYLVTLNVLLSFLGHYGVQLFIFISGYGLAKSYLSKQESFLKFVKKRIAKLYPAFLIGIVMLMSYNFILFADIPNNEWVKSISYKLFMVHTLIPNEALSVVGPWWFYGLIVQLYLLFIPMFYLIKKWKLKGFLLLITLSYIIVFLLYDPLEKNGIFIMANAPAHIPEFTLGILLALYPKFNLKPIYLPLLLLIFILGNFYFYFFPYTFIIVTYLMLVVILFVFKKKRFFSSVIAFYGKLSMFLFAIHGFIRNPFFVNTANSSNNPFINFALSLLYLLTATILAYLTRAIYLAMKKKVSLTLLKVNELLNTLQYQNTDEIQ